MKIIPIYTCRWILFLALSFAFSQEDQGSSVGSPEEFAEELPLPVAEPVDTVLDISETSGGVPDTLFAPDSLRQEAPSLALKDSSLAQQPQTCSELYQELKESQCGRKVLKYVGGMSVRVGLSLNTSSLELRVGDSLYARLVGLLTPAPYYAVSLSPKYFGNTGFGYQVAFDYTSSHTVQQVVQRGESKKYYDLHSLSVLSLAALTPSIFYDLVGSRENQESFLRLGLGLGLGWAGVKGVAYLTEAPTAANSCYDASSEVAEGNENQDYIAEECRLEPFQYSSLGASARIFLDGRKNWFYGAFEAVGVGLRSQRFEISPTAVKLKFAYIMDI